MGFCLLFDVFHYIVCKSPEHDLFLMLYPSLFDGKSLRSMVCLSYTWDRKVFSWLVEYKNGFILQPHTIDLAKILRFG